MEKKLFAVCVLLCLDLLLFVVIKEQYPPREIPASTTFYENVVAITFDDGPGAYTEELLDGLRERGVVASFFVVGSNIEGYESLIKRMQDEGHLIGNHTYSHIKLDAVGEAAACDEILRTCEAIELITGEAVKYIRPPYGAYSEKLERAVDLTEVLWSVDPQDWNTSNVNGIVRYVTRNVKDGDIILLHDIYPSSVAAALRIVDELKARGFVFVTVEDILIK